jgi:uncharacterized membrane protein
MVAGPGSRDLWTLLPESVRRLPADLAAVVVLVVLTVLAALVPVVSETPLRVLLGLPFVLFAPGYVVVAALFPRAGAPPGGSEDSANAKASDTGDGAGIDSIERVALSVGLSIAAVALTGLVLNATPWGVRQVPILVSVSAVVLIGVAVAAMRRESLPEEERLGVSYRGWIVAGRAELFDPDSRGDAALNVLLVLSVVLVAAGVGYAVAVPTQGEQFSELYLLTEDEDGGVADGYPTEFVEGESRSLVVGVRNHEHTTAEYTLIGKLQRVEASGANDSVNDTTGEASTPGAVLEEETIAEFGPELDHNESSVHRHNVTPTLVGDRLRLTYLLYEGSAPDDPGVENAYRAVHLWVNVSVSDPSA